jgi:cell division septal protein FtsQ
MIGTRNRKDKRPRGTNYTGVLRDERLPSSGDERPAIEHSEPRQKGFSWRVVSFSIVVILSVLIGFFYSAEAFYVRSISVGGLTTMTKEEIFALADIANMHIFWINPEDVRQNLLASSSLADAEVWLGWPPQMVNIVVEERQPAIVWEQDGVAMWVDVLGRIMPQRQDRPDLIVVQANADVAQGINADRIGVDPNIVLGALQLQELMPEITILRFDSNKGLGFTNPNGWQVWLGSGTNMPEKLKIYQTMTSNLVSRGIQVGELNIVDPDYVFYTVMWGR